MIKKLTFLLFGLNCQVLPGSKYQNVDELFERQNVVKISFQSSPPFTQPFYLFHNHALSITLQTVKNCGDNDDDNLYMALC